MGLEPLWASWVGTEGASMGWQLDKEELEGGAWLLGSSGIPNLRQLPEQGREWLVTWCPWAWGSVPSRELWPGHPERLHLDFGSTVPLRTRVTRQLILTNCSPIQTPFTLKFEYFGSPGISLSQKPRLYVQYPTSEAVSGEVVARAALLGLCVAQGAGGGWAWGVGRGFTQVDMGKHREERALLPERACGKGWPCGPFSAWAAEAGGF